MRSIWRWLDARLGFTSAILPIIVHPVPKAINWWYVLGSATLVAFIVQVVTGVALAFSYVPAPNSAYESLEFITRGAILGSVVRGIHYWGSSAMVVLICVHMVRTFLMGSYKFPRELNWLTGVALLGLTFGMAFTGQLLRWNQDAYWAVVVGAEQAARAPFVGHFLAQLLVAGQTVGGATLTRFYATHVFVFPAAMFALIGAHLYLVVRHGISEPPGRTPVIDPRTYQARYHEMVRDEGIPFWPDAAWKDVVFALGVGSVVLLLAVAVGPAELGERADPTIIGADPRPDWYFLWYFALLALLPSSIEDWFIIGFPALLGLALFLLPLVAPAGERRASRRPWAVGVVGFSAVGIAALVHQGNLAPWSPNFNPPPLPASVTQPLSGPAARGALLFQEKGCINCHTLAGVGGQRGPDLTGIGGRRHGDELISRILAGGRNMPAYGSSTTPQELSDIVAFLESQR